MSSAEYTLTKAALMPDRPGRPARLLQPGQRIVFDGTPTQHMKPRNSAGKAAWEKAFPAQTQSAVPKVPKSPYVPVAKAAPATTKSAKAANK